MYILIHTASRWWILNKGSIPFEGLGGIEVALLIAKSHSIVISKVTGKAV